MTVSATSDVYYDPYNVELNADPYPVFARLREEAPLYHNDQHDFYALSRFDDVNAAIVDHETFSSARGAIVEIIKSGMPIPPGTLIFEDPPIHNIHRNLLARLFTPRRISALEPRIREFTARCLDPLVGTGRFDFVNDLGALMPMQVIGMLLGIPEADQKHVVDHGDATLRTERGRPMTENPGGPIATGEVFADHRVEQEPDQFFIFVMINRRNHHRSRIRAASTAKRSVFTPRCVRRKCRARMRKYGACARSKGTHAPRRSGRAARPRS